MHKCTLHFGHNVLIFLSFTLLLLECTFLYAQTGQSDKESAFHLDVPRPGLEYDQVLSVLPSSALASSSRNCTLVITFSNDVALFAAYKTNALVITMS